jgi:hypothetical protein
VVRLVPVRVITPDAYEPDLFREPTPKGMAALVWLVAVIVTPGVNVTTL